MPRLPPKPTQLIIRLASHGCRNRPFHHIVVIQNKKRRDALPVEQLGTFDPMPNSRQEKLVAINFERLGFWLASGALVSKPVEKLLGLCFLFVCVSYFYPPSPSQTFTKTGPYLTFLLKKNKKLGHVYNASTVYVYFLFWPLCCQFSPAPSSKL